MRGYNPSVIYQHCRSGNWRTERLTHRDRKRASKCMWLNLLAVVLALLIFLMLNTDWTCGRWEVGLPAGLSVKWESNRLGVGGLVWIGAVGFGWCRGQTGQQGRLQPAHTCYGMVREV